MVKRILAASLAWLALASAALAQAFPPTLPAQTLYGRCCGFPTAGPAAAITLAQVQAAILYGETPVNDANYPMVAADRTIVYTALTATRTVTLLSASTFNAGFRLLLMDRSGNAALAHNITVAPTGADTINGVNSSATAVAAPFGGVTIESDGVSKWTIIATAPAASALSANSQPSRALAKLEMKPPLGVPLNATNRHPGFTRRLSCVTKSIAVSGNVPESPNAFAISATVHNGAALMLSSPRVRPPPRRDR